jgi:hypothetical protein
MSTDSTANQESWQKIVLRAWSEPRFKRNLLDNPSEVLAAEGFSLPTGVNVVVVEDEPNRVHLVLPAKPGEAGSAEAAAEALSYINPAI